MPERELLLQRLSSGDESAFTELFNNNHRKFHELAAYLLKNHWTSHDLSYDSEDIAQSVFIALWEQRGELHNVKNFSAFVHTISQRFIRDRYRRKQTCTRSERGFQQLFSINTTDTFHSLRMKEFWRAIQYCIQHEMHEKERESFMLVKYEDLSYKEASLILDISSESVRKNVYRASCRLKSFLARYQNDESGKLEKYILSVPIFHEEPNESISVCA